MRERVLVSRTMRNTPPIRDYLLYRPLLEHITCRNFYLRVLSVLALFCTFLNSYILDVPKPIYHCPMFDEDHGSSSSPFSLRQQLMLSNENCYWSTSYAEAREKFVALGNRLKAQTRRERERNGGNNVGEQKIINVQSISYDIQLFDPLLHVDSHNDKNTIIMSDNVAKEFDLFTPQTITPGTNTVDAILITLRTCNNSHNEDDSIVSETDDRNVGRRENLNIVHSSGVHGIEGFLGSAIQIRFLHELLLAQRNIGCMHSVNDTSAPPSATEATPSNSGNKVRKILLIHSVNPYGMRHHRRTNENNVDLNRNVLSKAMWKEVRTRHPNIYRYVDMDSMLNPFQSYNDEDGGYEGDVTDLTCHGDAQCTDIDSQQSQGQQDGTTGDIMFDLPPPKSNMDMLVSSLLEQYLVLRTLKEAFVAICTLGYTDSKRGIVAAQYHKQRGLSYGGGAHKNNHQNHNYWENSVLAVQHAIQEFGGYRFSGSSSDSSSPDSSSEGDRTLWIDVHTGLGKYGEYSILTTAAMEDHSSCPSPNNSWITKFNSHLHQQNMGYGQSSDSASVSAGYEQTKGFMNGSILCPPPYCSSLTQEFGTRPSIGVIVALILENLGYQTSGKEGRTYGHFLTWAFNPQRLSWRRKALRGGMEMIHAGIEF